MSTTIDQRVVEMRFDNKQFEANVSTTMSSLDKLKQRLNLTGASKGLEEVNNAAKKVDMSGLGSAIQTVHAKFSALEVMGITALTNITNQAVNAGKRLVAAFTIDPVKTGFNEYELKMGSIQTIMASTGESLETVNGYLNELNEYSDKTIYSFSDMTQNIGKFTNAGVKLEDAVLAIKGISNEAAVSGATANEASRAMYNFAQALSSGFVKLIDWKSIENANMATVEFKNLLIESAVAAGTLKKSSNGMYEVVDVVSKANATVLNATHNFNDSLGNQWMTTEVLINTLKDYADETTDIGKKAFGAAQDVKTFSMMMDTLKESAQSGWATTWEILVGDLEEAKKLWTGLTNFFGKIIDKMSDARNNFLRGALGKSVDDLISKIEKAGLSTEKFEKALSEVASDNGKNLKHLIEKYGSLTKVLTSGELSIDMIKDALKKLLGVEEKAAKATEDLGDIVNRVINLEFGNGEERVKKLTEAGYNYAQVQNLVNEKLGNSFRHHVELTEAQLSNADSLNKLSDAQLKEKGYTEEQIEALRDLQKAADESGTSIKELLDNLENKTGRELIIESFKNIAKYIGEILTPLKEAYNDVFGDTFSTENMSDGLYDLIDGFYELTTSLTVTEEQAANFKSVFEGLLSIFKVTGSIASKSVMSGIKLLDAVLGLFGTDILGVAGQIGEFITQFANWLDTNTIFMNQIDKLAEVIHAVIKGIKGCVDAFLELDAVANGVNKFIGFIKDAFDQLGISIDNLFGGDAKGFDKIIEMINGFFSDMQTAIRDLDTSELGSFIIKGLIIGLLTGASTFGIVKVMSRIGLMLINGFKAILGIHSPSKVFMAIGGFIIAGLILGLQNGSSELLTKAVELVKSFINNILTAIPEGFKNVKQALEENGGNALKAIRTVFGNIGNFLVEHVGGFFAKIVNMISKIDLGGVIAIALGGGIIFAIIKILDIVENLTKPLMTFSKVMGSAKGVLDAIKDRINGDKYAKAARTIFTIATAIGVLAISLFIVASIPEGRLLPALGAIAAVTVAVVAIAALAGKIGDVSITGNLGKLSLALLTLSGSLILMAATVKILSGIEATSMDRVIKAFLGMIVGMCAIILSLSTLNSATDNKAISQVGWTLIKMSTALLLMTLVMKQIAKMSGMDILKGLGVITFLELFFVGLIAVCKLANGGGFANAGTMLLQMSLALVLMLAVFKLAGKLKLTEVVNGSIAMIAFGVLVAVMARIAKNNGRYVGQIGLMAIGISAALILFTKACKLAGELSKGDLFKGLGAIVVLGLLMKSLIDISKGASGKSMVGVGLSLIMMAGALALIAGIMYIVKELEWPEVGKALTIVAVLEILFMGIIAAAKGVQDVSKTIMWLAITIGILTVALIALSFIPSEDLKPATLAIMGLVGVFAALVYVTKYAKDSKNMWKTLVPLGAIAILLGGLLYALAKLENPDAALTAAKGLSLVIVAFASSILILSKLKSDIQKAKSALLPMTGIIIVLAGVLGALASFTTKPEALVPSAIALGVLVNALAASLLILNKVGKISDGTLIAAAGMGAVLILLAGALSILKDMDPTAAIGNAVALSVLLLAVSGCLFILSKMNAGTNIGNMLLGILALSAMAIPLLLMVEVFSQMQDVKNATENVNALILLTGTLTLLLIPLALIGPYAINALFGLGVLTLMVVPLLAFVSVLEMMDGLENATENVMALIKLVGVLTIVLAALTVIGAFAPFAAAGIAAMTQLAGLIVAIGIVAVAIGGLMDMYPKLEEFLDKGISVLEKIAEGLGNVIGKFIEAIGNSIGNTLVNLGEDIKTFMSALAEASTSASNIKEGSFDGVKDLMEVMADIASTTIGTSIGDIFTLGGTSMEKFEKDGVAFFNAMKAIGEVSNEVKFDKTTVESVIDLAKELATLQSSLEPIGSVIDFFSGKDDLATFGRNAAAFIGSMGFAFSTLTYSKFNTEAMDAIIDAATELVKLQPLIEPIGGLNTLLKGKDDLGKFGTNVASFISSMKTAYGSLDECVFNTSAMDSIISATSSLAKIQHSVEEIGSAADFFNGRDDLGKFGTNVKSFIKSMVKAYSALDGAVFNTYAMDIVITATEKLANLQSSIEPIKPVIDFFSARDDLGTFGKNVAKFTESMVVAYSSLDDATFNTDGMSIIVTAAEELVRLQSSIEPIKPVIDFFSARDDLGTFGKNVAKFTESMVAAYGSLDDVTFNTDAMDYVVTAATSLANLQSSIEPIKPVINFFSARDDLGTFGKNVAKFTESMVTGFGSLDGCKFDTVAISSMITAATELSKIQSQLEPMGGVVSWFTGRDDLGKFGQNIGLFAVGMANLKVGMGEDGITQTVIDSIKNAGTAIIELQKALPSEGWFDGKMSLNQFSGYVDTFAIAMGNFGTKAVEIDSGAVTTVIDTAYKIKDLINSLTDINTDGLVAFTGVGTGGFGADGAAYKIAQAMSAYSAKVAGIDTAAVSTSVSAATTLKQLIGNLVGLDTSGIENFKVDTIATRIKSYADKVAGIDTTAVSTSVSAANNLKRLIVGLVGLDTSGVVLFDTVKSIGSAIKGYGENVSGINYETINMSVTNVKKLVGMIRDMVGLDASGVSVFKSAISNLATTNMAGFISAFKDTSKFTNIGMSVVNAIKDGLLYNGFVLTTAGGILVDKLVDGISSRKTSITTTINTIFTGITTTIDNKKETFKSLGVLIMTKFIEGMKIKKDSAKETVASIVSASAECVRDYYDSFYSAGSYLVDGLADGISENSYKAAAKAAAMASAAYSAAKAALAINSPSKLFRSLGYSVPEGFAMGIDRLAYMAKNSAISMTDMAVDGVKNSISRIADAVNTDIDTQPTIRPVLDLSDVESGASVINGLFNNTASVGVMANVGSINTMMNRRNQNGPNSDVISAIDKLRDKINNVGNTYYTIDGITYSNGTEVADAITSLTRAIKMEGRV